MILKIDRVAHSSLATLVNLLGEENNQIGGYNVASIKEVKPSNEIAGFNLILEINEVAGQPGYCYRTPRSFILHILDALNIFPELEQSVSEG